VFVLADDPVKSGLVTSLNRPGGNLTGVTFFGGESLGVKRLELLHELTPKGSAIAVLLDPNYPEGGSELPAVEAAARGFGRPVMVVRTESERDFEGAFAGLSEQVPVPSWSTAVRSSQANGRRSSRWPRAMPSRRVMICATMSKMAA
jgi:putative ABC transport system substrate-binding protein